MAGFECDFDELPLRGVVQLNGSLGEITAWFDVAELGKVLDDVFELMPLLVAVSVAVTDSEVDFAENAMISIS